LLDARDDLSLQVHPPAHRAMELGGEPKTEMWYVAEADADAAVYVGVQPGTTPMEFERRSRDGTVAGLFHRLPVQEGDVLFLPSGRVHALGRGLVILEIQQNSDTTYRVFDWNRVGLDGRPRALHLAEAMQSIDFSDTSPSLVPRGGREEACGRVRELVRHELFQIDHVSGSGVWHEAGGTGAWMLAVVKGSLAVTSGGFTVNAVPGDFVVVPAALRGAELKAGPGAEWLRVTRGNGGTVA
jgi:mannose-6-phosphate isomerase